MPGMPPPTTCNQFDGPSVKKKVARAWRPRYEFRSRRAGPGLCATWPLAPLASFAYVTVHSLQPKVGPVFEVFGATELLPSITTPPFGSFRDFRSFTWTRFALSFDSCFLTMVSLLNL